MSASQNITEKITSIPQGTPFTARELSSVSSNSNVRKVLERLTASSKIIRIRRGLYVRPEISRYVGPVLPSISILLESIAKTTGEIIQVHGAEALRQLGISTQVPLNPIYLTSGRTRKISLGKMEIQLRHAASRKLILAGTQAGVAIIALWYLGKENVNENTIMSIKNAIGKEQYCNLLENKKYMPLWMAEKLY